MTCVTAHGIDWWEVAMGNGVLDHSPRSTQQTGVLLALAYL